MRYLVWRQMNQNLFVPIRDPNRHHLNSSIVDAVEAHVAAAFVHDGERYDTSKYRQGCFVADVYQKRYDLPAASARGLTVKDGLHAVKASYTDCLYIHCTFSVVVFAICPRAVAVVLQPFLVDDFWPVPILDSSTLDFFALTLGASQRLECVVKTGYGRISSPSSVQSASIGPDWKNAMNRSMKSVLTYCCY